ncbi:MAG: glycosyltransferase family 2 protein [Acidobacteria bacterium]|nr:glycosyltransferase family 2 protein [Acidobacteriota bacterium]
MADLFLSVVVPAYNESPRIGPTLEKILAYLRRQSYEAEIVVVDDGSRDRTGELVRALAASHPEIRLLANSVNRGKGAAVRQGVLDSQGKWVLFSDADLSTPIEEVEKLLAAVERDRAVAAVGSRALRRELIGVHQPLLREWSGRFFNVLVRLATGLKIHDTQCGFKLFHRRATRVAFLLQTSQGFGFDPELLYLVQLHAGRIVEIPVRWDNSPATKVRFLRDSLLMLLDLLRLCRNRWQGRYRPRRA